MFAIAEAQQYTWQTGQIYAETDSKIDLFVMPRQYSIYDNIGTIMTPEEKARQKIDQWFAEAGWKVINREDYEPTCTAVAIREGLLKGNLEADYFLFINGKAVGVL